MQMLWKRALGIVLGGCVGGALAVGASALWGILRPAHQPLGSEQIKSVQHLLDEAPTGIFMYDPATSFRYKPAFHGYRVRPAHLGARNARQFAHVTNSLGLMGGEEVSADPQRAKVLLLGDSVAYGEWLDGNDAFPARLQRLAGSTCQVLLGACEGWSTKQEIAFYDAYLSRVDWREIVIVFCLNDLVDFEWTYDSATGPRLTEEVLSVGNGGTRTNETIGGLKLAALKHRFAADPKTAPLANQTNTSLWAWEDDRWTHYLDATLAPFVTRRDHPRVSIVLAPSESQLRALALGAAPTLVLHPQLRLSAFCERAGLVCVDLVEAFAGVPAERLDSMFLDDLHFSEEGHAAIAEFLWPQIRQLLQSPATHPGG